MGVCVYVFAQITHELGNILIRFCIIIILLEATKPLYLLISCHYNSILVTKGTAVVAGH